jgi:hypothetical protein
MPRCRGYRRVSFCSAILAFLPRRAHSVTPAPTWYCSCSIQYPLPARGLTQNSTQVPKQNTGPTDKPILVLSHRQSPAFRGLVSNFMILYRFTVGRALPSSIFRALVSPLPGKLTKKGTKAYPLLASKSAFARPAGSRGPVLRITGTVVLCTLYLVPCTFAVRF